VRSSQDTVRSSAFGGVAKVSQLPLEIMNEKSLEATYCRLGYRNHWQSIELLHSSGYRVASFQMMPGDREKPDPPSRTEPSEVDVEYVFDQRGKVEIQCCLIPCIVLSGMFSTPSKRQSYQQSTDGDSCRGEGTSQPDDRVRYVWVINDDWH
jgi:hypothetical protein